VQRYSPCLGTRTGSAWTSVRDVEAPETANA
jgi:hypothetical protein